MPSRRGVVQVLLIPGPFVSDPCFGLPGLGASWRSVGTEGAAGGPCLSVPWGLSTTMRLGARERLRGGIILERFLLQPIGQSSPVFVGGG